MAKLFDMARTRCAFGYSEAPDDARVWAVDALFFAVGCTHRRCHVGVLGAWRPLPNQKFDLWLVLGLHAAACGLYHTQGPGPFYRLCSPRFSAPHTFVTAIVATASPFELIWMYGNLIDAGSDVQRALGRIGFLILCALPPFPVERLPTLTRSGPHPNADALGGLSSAVAAAYCRHSANGAGGTLAVLAFHFLRQPSNVRFRVMNIQMSPVAALGVQALLAAVPSLSGDRPQTALALVGAPVVLGATCCFLWLRVT
jgi:hypothetical protein